MAAAGMDFAMIRAGYRGYTLGTIQKDAYFEANMAGALANGLEVGVYFFSHSGRPWSVHRRTAICSRVMGSSGPKRPSG